MQLSTMYHEPRLPLAGWKIAAAAVVALLAIAAGAFAFVNYGGTAAFSAQSSAPSSSAVTLGVVSGAPGAAVEVPIRLTSAQAVGSLSVALDYDPAVVHVSGLQNGNVPQSTLTWTRDATTGAIVMLLTTSLASGASGSFTFGILTLEAVEGAAGAVSDLALEVRGAASTDGEAVTIAAQSGAFRNGVPGDVSGDGIVDWDDYGLLATYLVGEPVEILALNADVTGDGKVTHADALRLHQHLDGSRPLG